MSSNATALLAVDKRCDLRSLQDLLMIGGFRVRAVELGWETLTVARELRPHLLMLGLLGSPAAGLEICRAVRADPALRKLPVLVLGEDQNTTAGSMAAALQAGADDWIPWSAPSELLIRRLQRLVFYQRLMDQVALDERLIRIGRLLVGVVHEIRGPLSVIHGSAELLGQCAQLDREAMQWLDAILRNSEILQRRLEHLMSAVQTSNPRVQPVRVNELADEAVQIFIKTMPPGHRSVAIELRPDLGELEMLADPGRIIQVLLDLLSNAQQSILAARGNGKIVLETGTLELGGTAWVRLDVIDDGPGIGEEHLERIFEPFFTTKPAGTGYGLYLAAEIVKEHQGRLMVHNREEGGAHFTICLPSAGGGPPRSSGHGNHDQ
jgi:signal transduction histidine kinase